MSIINKIKELINNFKLNTELRAELEQKEKECEELHERTANIIHCLTGGRLSYSTYTLEGCEDAYADQLRIDVERATKELQEENGELKAENFAFENLVKTQENLIDNLKNKLQAKEQECEKLKKQYNCNACGTCKGKEDYKNMQRHCKNAIA